jgi:hypothetical protein
VEHYDNCTCLYCKLTEVLDRHSEIVMWRNIDGLADNLEAFCESVQTEINELDKECKELRARFC